MRQVWQQWNFISGDKISCKHCPKWNHMKGNPCTCVNKNDWFLFNWSFISDYPRNEIHFILPVMIRNVNKISFMVDGNFVSGRFHFRSHINTLQDRYLLLWSLVIVIMITFFNSCQFTVNFYNNIKLVNNHCIRSSDFVLGLQKSNY